MEFKGEVIKVLKKVTGTSKTGAEWAKQEYVLKSDGQYPKHLCIEVFGEEKINQFNIQLGQVINAHLNVDSREWQERWFNQIQVWKVDLIEDVSGVKVHDQTPDSVGDLPF